MTWVEISLIISLLAIVVVAVLVGIPPHDEPLTVPALDEVYFVDGSCVPGYYNNLQEDGMVCIQEALKSTSPITAFIPLDKVKFIKINHNTLVPAPVKKIEVEQPIKPGELP